MGKLFTLTVLAIAVAIIVYVLPIIAAPALVVINTLNGLGF